MAGIITDKIRKLNPEFNHGYIPMPGTEFGRIYFDEDLRLMMNRTGVPEEIGTGGGTGLDIDGGRADTNYGAEPEIDCGGA